MPGVDWGSLDEAKLERDLAIFDRRISEIIRSLNWKLALLPQSSGDDVKILITKQLKALKEVQQLTHDYVTDLMIASKTQSPEAKQSFHEKFNKAVDTLLEIDAFKHDKNLNKMTGNTALWSKLNQTFASDIAKEKQGVTLEGSLAGYLYDGLMWGTSWSTDPDAPMKKFWMRMSVEIAKAASNSPDKIVDLYVLEQVVKESAFFTDEWPRIKKSIENGELEALYVYKFELAEDKRNRSIFVMDKLPDSKMLSDKKFENTYVFTKDPAGLYFVENGKAQPLKMSDNNKEDQRRVEKYIKAAMELPSSNDPLQKDSETARDIRFMISRNPEHRMYHTLKTGAPIAVKTQEELQQQLKEQTPEYKQYQQQWQNLQSAKGKSRQWADSIVRLNRAGKLDQEYDKAEAKRTSDPRPNTTNFFSHPLDQSKAKFDEKNKETNKTDVSGPKKPKA